MIFINNTKLYATVWNVDRKEKYTDLRISTSEKGTDGNYINSNWFARMIGHSHQKLKNLNERDRIIITQAKLTNEGYTDKDGNKKSAFKFLILEAESADKNNNETAAKPENKATVDAPDEEDKEMTAGDGDMPW